MHVTIRKGPPTEECPEGKVVIETWMTPEEVKACAHRQPALEDAIESGLKEHMGHRHRVTRQVKTGRFA